MYIFIKIRHEILIQSHGNNMMMQKIQFYAWDWHLKKFLTKKWVSWGVLFKGLGVQKDTQTPCWRRPWFEVYVWSSALTQHYHLEYLEYIEINQDYFLLSCHFSNGAALIHTKDAQLISTMIEILTWRQRWNSVEILRTNHLGFRCSLTGRQVSFHWGLGNGCPLASWTFSEKTTTK